jgi:hypothetical protein
VASLIVTGGIMTERKTTEHRGATPARTPGEPEEAPRKGAGEMEEASERQEELDPREEEGYAQPESSAQKFAPPGPDVPR